MSRSLKAGTGVLVTLVLAFGVWWAFLRDDGPSSTVFASVVPAVKVAPLAPPQYAAEMTHRLGRGSPGVVVAADGTLRRVFKGYPGTWLDDGRYLLGQGRRHPDCTLPPKFSGNSECSDLVPVTLDVTTGLLSTLPGVREMDYYEFPGDAVHRVTLAALPGGLVTFNADATAPQRVKLPRYDGDDKAMSRNTSRRVFSIGDWDYVAFSDNDGEDASESYGYLRRHVGSTRWTTTLEDQRLVALWVSRDGRALLGLQQTRGEPCGGCSRSQQIVEIDPDEGKIVGSYGVPKGYDKSWRVATIDKIGSRVLVRYIRRTNLPENLGVWQYDGSWSLVKGTTGPFTWWQGPHDRIEARPAAGPPQTEDLVPYELVWVHGTHRTRLLGQVDPDAIAGWAGIPGSLVPPA